MHIKKTLHYKLGLVFAVLLLQSCSSLGKPDGVTPVKDFDVNRYLGQWYEIARLDHKFERGLEQVTATYSLNPDGTVKVLNKGFSTKKQKWQEAEGKARFVGDDNEGFLKVSFFGPFYGSYVIFELDKTDYQYALVSGPDRGYLWLLSRLPELDIAAYDALLAKAEAVGFDTSELIKVNQ